MKTRFAVWSGQVLLVALVGCSDSDNVEGGSAAGSGTVVARGGGPGTGGKATAGSAGTSSGGGPGTGGAPAAGGTTAVAGGTNTGGTTATGGTGSGGTPAATGGTGAGGTDPGTAGVDEHGMPLLPQEGNPINTAIDNYKKYLPGNPEGDKRWGDVVVSWQFTTGAYPKSGFDHEYTMGIATEEQRAATQAGRQNLGTFDNGSTITELASLGYTYKTFKDPKHKAAAQKTMEWILSAQGSTGGWPQWYPARTGSAAYSGHATFNDEGMMRVMIALQKAVRKQDPFDSDIFTDEQLTKSKAALTKGVEYVLKAQILMDGKPTVWCAQHNMQTYAPESARAYELPSKSGQESALVAAFLMSRHQTPEITKAVEGAVGWYNNPEVYVADKKYVRPTAKDGSSPYVDAPGQKMWYRFYELNTNRGYFSDRDGVPVFDIQQIGEERYTGYVWAGAWGQNLLTYAAKVGMLK